jgi:hypothetical protein
MGSPVSDDSTFPLEPSERGAEAQAVKRSTAINTIMKRLAFLLSFRI